MRTLRKDRIGSGRRQLVVVIAGNICAMRWLLVLVMLAWSAVTASAQVVPPPMIEEPKMTLGASGTIWVPQGDADDTSDTSLGLRAHFTYRVNEWIAPIGTLDLVFVNEDGDADVSYYSLSAGARVIKARPGQLEPYGEALLGYHVLDVEGADSESEIGFRIGGGILYPVGQKMLANVALNYSAVSFDFGLADVDVNALIFEVGIAMRL